MLNNEKLNILIKNCCHFHISNNHFYFNKKEIDELLKNVDVFNYLNEVSEKTSISKDDLIKFVLTGVELNSCSTCGKFFSFKERNKKYCSIKCMMNSIEYQKKRHCSQKRNLIDKYGVENPGQLQTSKNKIKNTCLKKYGVTNYLKTNECKTKIKNTCLKKYGKEFYTQTEDWKKKIISSCLKKYGKEFYTQTDEFKERNKLINLKQFGKEHFKTLQAWKHILTLDFVKPMFSFEDFKGTNEIKYKWKCMNCNNEFISEYDNGFPVHVCPFCKDAGISKSENELKNFCKEYFSNCRTNDRALIFPYELDVIIDEIKICLEFNGVYWHDVNHVPRNYHLNKTRLCNEKGYRLIHIWEDEWIENKEEIKRKLIDIFNGNEAIDFSNELDRSWYNNLKGEFEETSPEIRKRLNFNVEDCGKLIKK